MEPKFIEVGGIVLNLSQVSSVRFEAVAAVVYMAGGAYNHEFRGQDAQALRQFFMSQPVPTAQEMAQKESEIGKVSSGI